MGLTRRTILAAGTAAAATTAVPRIFAEQSGRAGTGKFYERGPVRIYYEEAGSGRMRIVRIKAVQLHRVYRRCVGLKTLSPKRR